MACVTREWKQIVLIARFGYAAVVSVVNCISLGMHRCLMDGSRYRVKPTVTFVFLVPTTSTYEHLCTPRTYNIVKDMPQYMVSHCFTRGLYYYSYARFGRTVGGAYTVDDFGTLVKVDH